jgi:hypothetical protein
MPETSTADITPRRLQQFRVRPGKSYRWRLLRNGKSVASGTVFPDVANLLTIPRLTLNLTPVELVIEQAAGQDFPGSKGNATSSTGYIAHQWPLF